MLEYEQNNSLWRFMQVSGYNHIQVQRHIMISSDWPAVGQYVDFKDHDHVWGVGLILSKNDHYIKIRNEGWGQRYDENIPLTEDLFNTPHAKIQPFRSVIRGYTGIRKNPSPREHWKYTRDDHEDRLKKLEDFSANLNKKSKEELVQYLRGQHYFYIDFLMGNLYTTLEDMNKVYEYFTQHLLLVKKFIEHILAKGVINSFINTATKRDQSCSWEETYEHCYYELIDAMYNISGMQDRLITHFIKQNEDLIKQVVGVYEKHQYYISTQVQNQHLFEMIMQLIQQVHKTYLQHDMQVFRIPFAFHYSLFQLFYIIQPIFLLQSMNEKGGQIFDCIFDIISKGIERVQPNDMKQVQIDRQLQCILLNIRATAARYNRSEKIALWPEETRMRVCMLFLRCDKLEKKIRGISKVRQVAERTIKEDIGCFGAEALGEMLSELKIMQELFVQNEHIQIFKKSTELVSLLYKYDIIDVDQLCFLWNNSINKHPLIVSHLFQFWIQMAYVLQYEDILRYALIATPHQTTIDRLSPQYRTFFLDLVIAIINNNVKSSVQYKIDTPVQDSVDSWVTRMITIAYQILQASKGQTYFNSLIGKYSTIIIEHRSSQQLLEEIYKKLTKQDHLKICLQILKEVYVIHDRIDVYVHDDICIQMIECLKNPQITSAQVLSVFQILNTIMSFCSRKCLTNKQFEMIWQFFQGSKQQMRHVFYSWLMRNDEIHDNFTSHLNVGLTSQLKRFILSQIVSNQRYLNYGSLTKKQLSIVLQVFIQVNSLEGRIEKKKLMEGYRFIHRIKTIDLLNQSTLWDIFEQCKSEQVIHYLIRYLIKFYFNFSPSLAIHLRKSRIDDIMERVMKNIREGHKGSNNRLVRHSLLLLRGIFQVVKEEEKTYYTSDAPFTYKVKVEVKYLSNLYRFDIGQNQTISCMKIRIAERLKLKPGSFKMLVNQQNNVEELDYTFKNVTVVALRKCQVEVVEIGKDEETVARFVSSFINEDLEGLLVDMLQNQMVASEVYLLIEELDLQLEKLNVLDKINKILEKYEGQGRTVSNVQIYYHMLQLKIFSRILQKEGQAQTLPKSPSFLRMLRCMKCSVQSDYHVSFLYKLQLIIIKTIRKVGSAMKELQLPQHLFSIIYEISKFLLKNREVDHHTKECSIKIIEQGNIIIQHFIGSSNIIKFYVSQSTFSDFIASIYLNNQIQYIRMIYTDKFGKYFNPNPNQHFHYFQPHIQDFLLELFIDKLYFRVKEKQIESSEEGNQNESSYDFCMILAKIIAFITPERINNTSIFNPIKGRQKSFFEQCINLIKNIKQFNFNNFHLNYLLCGHFYIILACFQHRPHLLEPWILDFAMEKCLALSGNVSEPLCKKMEHINETFKFINGLIISNRDIKFIRQIVQALTPCHYLQLWRTNINWNVSSKNQPKQLYRGLINPGCICYMNSLLQQLYMIDDFRLEILNIQAQHGPKITQEKEMQEEEMENKASIGEEEVLSTEITMLQGMKELFLKLQFSEQNNINPTGFAKTLKTSDRRPMIRINEQMDIDQFASILFEKLERGITQKGQSNFVKRLFGGVYGHQIISLECNHRSERDQQFFSMSLDVKDNILKSFESLVKPELLDGGNKYHCEKCDKKVKAQKLQTIKQLPPYLILCLKRFQFDYDIDAKIKINDYCQFPQKLNLLPFSMKQILKDRCKDDIESQNKMEDQSAEFSDGHFNYKLRGVVVHTGSADSGHYYSFIDNNHGNWFEFNDEDVMPFDLDRLPEEAYGCKPSKYDLKTKNAYLLIYERIQNQHTKLDQQKILNKNEHQKLIEKILRKNRDIRKSELVFSDQYEHLVRRIQVNLHHITCPTNLQLSWYKYYLSFYFLIKARKENIQYFLVFSKSIENLIINSQVFCSLFLTCYASPKFIEEMFVFNIVRDKCRVMASLLTIAMECNYKNNKQISFERNVILSNVFDCLRAIFIVYGPIGELLTTLRKFFEIVNDQDDWDCLYKIIEIYNFEQIIFNSALNISPDKRIKGQCQRYCKNKIFDVDFLAPLPFYGKKMHTMNYGQAWKICSIMLSLNNIYIEKPENELKDERDFYINNINYLKRCLCDSSIESKMMNIITESSSNKAIYFLYNSLKELQLHTKIFPVVEKALRDYESIKYRPFFLYLEHAINDKSLTHEHHTFIVDLIERSYKNNDKYFLETDSIHQWILRFASMNETFLELLELKTAFVQEMYSKIARYPFPSITDLNKKFKHHTNEKYLNRYLGILVSTQIRQYQKNSRRMKTEYQDIRNMTFTTTVDYMPPEDNFKVGDRIELFDLTVGKWKKAIIISQHLGQLTIKKDVGEQSKLQLWQDSQKIRKLPPSRLIQAEFTPPQSDLSCSSESDYSIHRR